MMILFSYIFYRINKVYKTRIDELHPYIWSSALTSLFQTINLFTLLYFIFGIKTSVIYYIIVWSPICILNWVFFFNSKKLKNYESKWDKEKEKQKLIRGILVILYIGISIFFFAFALHRMH